ncbi:hypothetical protein HZA86_01520 [Candidatus Uhrbacteria bacterium]|nr:hypothetical protein [Candidatus Uhrbacteria bacterium]
MTLFQKILIFAFVTLVIVISSVVLVVTARKTRDAVRVADVSLLQNMLEIGFHRSARYPATGLPAGEYAVLGQGPFLKLCFNNQAQPLFALPSTACDGGVLLEQLPRDPQWINSAVGAGCADDPSSACEYSYAVSDDGKNYQIRFRLEGPTGALQCSRYPCIKALTKDGLQ